MCGILGISGSVDRNRFSKALSELSHRGPDGQGVWQDSDRMALGHTRLSILDTSSNGAQPMHYRDQYHIVFNGEIYNFIELKRDLKRAGYIFVNESDTEVILAAFDAWGEECVNRFNGMWAFAIWDSREERLFLSRDPVGEKPLFYFCLKNEIGFASEQKALLPFLPEVAVSKTFKSMVRDTYGYESTRKSLFRYLQRFPAGHNGWYKNGVLETKRYWHPNLPNFYIPSSYDGQVEMFRDLLADSCKLRLRSDVPIGTGLSGGIDSSTIAACVSYVGRGEGTERLATAWQTAFVASFPGTVMDETRPAKQIAEHLNIKLIEVLLSPDNLARDVESNAYMLEEIHEVNPSPHVNLYRQMREHGVVVTLDGHGGDELFCGYESSLLHALPTAFPNIDETLEVLNTYRDIHPDNEEFNGFPTYRIPAYLLLAKARHCKRFSADDELKHAAKTSESLEAHLLDLTYQTVLPTLLRNYDRYSMLSGVEVRSPFLDPRIIKFAMHLPWQSKIRNGFSKSIVRDAMEGFVPTSILRNKKKLGFAPPISDWMKGPLREYLMDETESAQFINSELINGRNLSKKIRTIILSRKNKNLYRAEQVWKEFGIYLWEKAYFKTRRWSRGV